MDGPSGPGRGKWGQMDVIARVERQLDSLARRMLDTIVDQVPLYAHLPVEQLEGEILAICRANLDFFLGSLRDGGHPAPTALAAVKASAARRAEERVPLDAVLVAYNVGSQVAWGALRDAAEPEDAPELVDMAGALMTYIQTVTSAVSDAYVEERGAIAGHERDARRALLDALLAGDVPPRGLAGFAGEPAYVVAALAIGPSGDEQEDGVEAAVAERRKMRRVEDFLAEAGGGGTLTRIDAGGGLALFPVGPGEAPALAAEVGSLVEGLAKTADASVWAGVACSGGALRVAEQVAEAREVLRLARTLGRAPGAYALDDVALEYVVAGSERGRERLSAMLEPLADGPDLIPTLAAWFDADFDRRSAAARLHVHPNTLDYRLKRVADLTGIDPGSARGGQILGAALLARRIAGTDGAEGRRGIAPSNGRGEGPVR